MQLSTLIHMISGAIFVMLFAFRLFQLLIAHPVPTASSNIFSKLIHVLPHLLYSVIFVTGLWQIHILVRQTHMLPYWVVAKIILFVGAVIAYGWLTRTPVDPKRQQAGILLGLICLSGILYLAAQKPIGAFMFGAVASAEIPADLHDNQDALEIDDSMVNMALDEQEPLPEHNSTHTKIAP